MSKEYQEELTQLRTLRQEAMFYDHLGHEFDLMVYVGASFILASTLFDVSSLALVGSIVFIIFGMLLSQKCTDKILHIENEVKILLANSKDIKWK